MQFIRDVFAVSLGVFLGFVAIVNTHDMLDIVYAFSQLEPLRFLADFELSIQRTVRSGLNES
jgi:hypothetical protein